MTRILSALLVCAVVATVSGQSPGGSSVVLPSNQQFTNADRRVVAFAPDGSRFVYVANQRLYIEAATGGLPNEIPGTASPQGVSNPVFSPDGQSIAYWSGTDGSLKRIGVAGGTATTIARVDNPFGMSWGPGDVLVVGQGAKGVVSVAAAGGTPRTIVAMAGDELAYGPQLLPSGDAVLFSVISGRTALASGWDRAQIVVQPIAGGARKTVVEAGRDGRIASGGNLLYVLNGQLRAVKFDSARREVSGRPTIVADGVRTAGPTGAAQFAVSDSGALVYLPERSGETELALVGLDGTKTVMGAIPNAGGSPRVSPDGRQVALASEGSIWAGELENVKGMRKIIAGTNYAFPVYSDDGRSLVLGTILPAGLETVYLARADGSGEMELLARPARAPEHWFPGTQMFSFITHKGRLDYDVWTYSLPNREVTPISRIPVTAQLSSRISPDGKWVVYMSNETGDYQVYLEPWPQTGARFQVTKSGAVAPVWSSDSAAIYYESNQKLYSISFQNGVDMFGQARELQISGFVPSGLRRNFDQTPDGKQFVMIFRSSPRVTVIPKWTGAS